MTRFVDLFSPKSLPEPLQSSTRQRSPGLRGHDSEYADTGNDRPYSDAEKKSGKLLRLFLPVKRYNKHI